MHTPTGLVCRGYGSRRRRPGAHGGLRTPPACFASLGFEQRAYK
ncbi:hypothetical protein [Streptomyces profundus]|nr:hypothetical protein [Streptomyces sp. MA3_2.13]